MKRRFPLSNTYGVRGVIRRNVDGGNPPPVTDLTFGALTLVGAGARSISAADGVYGPYTVSGGMVSPNTRPVTPGTYDVGGVTVTAEADVYDVGTGQLNAVIALGSSALSGKTIKILPGAQANGTAIKSITTIGPSVVLSSPLVITSRDYANPGKMRRVTWSHSGVVEFNNVIFYDEWLNDAGGDTGIIRGETANFGSSTISELYLIDCEVSSESHTTWDFSPPSTTDLVVGELYKPATITNADWSSYVRRGNAAGDLGTAVEVDSLYYCYNSGSIVGLGTAYPALRSLYGVTCAAAGTNQVRRITVTDCYIHDLAQGIAGVTGGWDRFTVQRTKFMYTFGDMIGTAYKGNEGVWTIEDNMFGAAMGAVDDVFQAHCDSIQINQDFLTQTSISPVYIRRNRFWNKDGGQPTQCVFLATQYAGAIPYTMQAIIEDNLILSGQASAIVNTIHGPGSVIQRNTVVHDINPAVVSMGNVPKIGTGTGKGLALDIRDNLHSGFVMSLPDEAATVEIMTNNQQFPTFTQAGFDDYLTGPTFSSADFATLDDFTAAMLSKGGTSIDSAFPKIGAGQYCTYGVSNLGTKSGLGSGTTTSPVTSAPAAFASGQWQVYAGDAKITVEILSKPADNGATISAIQYRLNGGSWVTSARRGVGYFEITGLTNGTTYTVELRAVNAAGNGAVSDIKTATPTYVYTQNAVQFDGGEYTYQNTGFTATGSKYALFAATFYCASAAPNGHRLVSFLDSGGVERAYINFASSSRLTFTANDAAGATICNLLSAVGTIAANTWYTVVFALDTTKATNAERLQGYIRPSGGAWSSLSVGAGINTSVLDGVIPNCGRYRVNYTPTAAVYYQDVYGRVDATLDLSVGANRDRFLPTVDKGIDGSIPTGTAPALFLSGATPTWHQNKGTGGGISLLSGTLSTAPSVPA